MLSKLSALACPGSWRRGGLCECHTRRYRATAHEPMARADEIAWRFTAHLPCSSRCWPSAGALRVDLLVALHLGVAIPVGHAELAAAPVVHPDQVLLSPQLAPFRQSASLQRRTISTRLCSPMLHVVRRSLLDSHRMTSPSPSVQYPRSLSLSSLRPAHGDGRDHGGRGRAADDSFFHAAALVILLLVGIDRELRPAVVRDRDALRVGAPVFVLPAPLGARVASSARRLSRCQQRRTPACRPSTRISRWFRRPPAWPARDHRVAPSIIAILWLVFRTMLVHAWSRSPSSLLNLGQVVDARQRVGIGLHRHPVPLHLRVSRVRL